MKVSHHDWTFRLLVMGVLCLTLRADNKPGMCEIEINVHRNTNYEASVGQKLQIECPVVVCNNTLPTMTWIKIESKNNQVNLSSRITTEWTGNNKAEKTFNLIFQKVQNSDSGLYGCQGEKTISHFINVTVTDELVNDTAIPQGLTNNTSTDNQDMEPMLLYLYTAAGIVGFVIIVIVISVLSMQGCNGETKNNAQRENQYMDIPMIEQRVHHSSTQALPRASPCGTPSHRTSRRTKPPPAPAPRDNIYGQVEGHRDGPEEPGSSVVYAALNHQHLAGVSPRARTVVEERSEYAAIRVS